MKKNEKSNPNTSHRPAFRLRRPLPTGSRAAEAQEANLDKTQLRASAEAAPAQDNKGGAIKIQ